MIAEIDAFSAVTIAPPAELQEQTLAETLKENRLDGKGAATQQIYRLLHGLIVSLRLLPNQMLPINEIEMTLGVSKTPIREAFIRLAEEGLVNIIPQKGTFVAPIDIHKAFEGYFIRISLESACARLLIKRRDQTALALLEQELDKQKSCVERGDSDEFYILDNQYHDTMFSAAGLNATRRLINSAKAEVERIKSFKSVYRFCRVDDVLYREHHDIFDAIATGDIPLVHKAIKHHLTGMTEAIMDIAKEERLWGMVKSINEVASYGKMVLK